MKEIKEEIKTYKTKYQAIDGETFDSKEECAKYEGSAKAVLMARYNKLVKKSDSECNFINLGCDDNDVDVVILKSKEDSNMMKQLYCLMNGYDIKDEDKYGWRTKAFNAIDKSLNDNDPLLVGKRLYDDCMWINGTKSEMIKKIEDFCKVEETKPEPEYGGC